MSSTIPFLNLKKMALAAHAEYAAAIADVLDKTSFIGGAAVSNFEKQFAAFVGEGNICVGMGNGTDAITIAAKSLRLPPGSEVIVPAMTYVATAAGLIHAGFRVKLVDVEDGSWLMDLALLKNAITPDTRLFAPVHLYGQMVAMDEVRALADEHEVKVMEDSAQAHGSLWKNKPPGYWGEIATYSFYPGKNLGAFGDAGAVVTRDQGLAQLCRQLGNQGGLVKYEHDVIGYNSRLDTIQAAVLAVKLKFLNQYNEARRSIASLYTEMLSDLPGISLPVVRKDAHHTYHLFVILVQDRESFMSHMKKNGIETGIHYPKAIHQLAAFRDFDFSRQSFPNAEKVARHGVSLPICPTLSISEVEQVAHAARRFFE